MYPAVGFNGGCSNVVFVSSLASMYKDNILRLFTTALHNFFIYFKNKNIYNTFRVFNFSHPKHMLGMTTQTFHPWLAKKHFCHLIHWCWKIELYEKNSIQYSIFTVNQNRSLVVFRSGVVTCQNCVYRILFCKYFGNSFRIPQNNSIKS